MPDFGQYDEDAEEHVRSFFAGHDVEAVTFERGPIQELVPGWHALEIGPGPQSGLWTYASIGSGRSGRAPRLEFVAASSEPSDVVVARLAMVTHYHATESLGDGHTLPIGEPWIPGSTLDHILISTPYPFGPELEHFRPVGEAVRFLWVLPIWESERSFKKARGLDALEDLFEQRGIDYGDICREPVV